MFFKERHLTRTRWAAMGSVPDSKITINFQLTS